MDVEEACGVHKGGASLCVDKKAREYDEFRTQEHRGCQCRLQHLANLGVASQKKQSTPVNQMDG